MRYRLDTTIEDRSRYADDVYRWGAECARVTDAELTDEMLAAYRDSHLELVEVDDREFGGELFDENFRRGWEDERVVTGGPGEYIAEDGTFFDVLGEQSWEKREGEDL